MKPKIVSKTFAIENQRWRLNEDGSWSTLMFGSFMKQPSPGLIWKWVLVPKHQVPDSLIKEIT